MSQLDGVDEVTFTNGTWKPPRTDHSSNGWWSIQHRDVSYFGKFGRDSREKMGRGYDGGDATRKRMTALFNEANANMGDVVDFTLLRGEDDEPQQNRGVAEFILPTKVMGHKATIVIEKPYHSHTQLFVEVNTGWQAARAMEGLGFTRRKQHEVADLDEWWEAFIADPTEYLPDDLKPHVTMPDLSSYEYLFSPDEIGPGQIGIWDGTMAQAIPALAEEVLANTRAFVENFEKVADFIKSDDVDVNVDRDRQYRPGRRATYQTVVTIKGNTKSSIPQTDGVRHALKVTTDGVEIVCGYEDDDNKHQAWLKRQIATQKVTDIFRFEDASEIEEPPLVDEPLVVPENEEPQEAPQPEGEWESLI